MSLSTRLFGIIPTTLGALLAYGIYLFLFNVYILACWISTYINAPESLAIVLTILVIIAFLELFTIIVGIIIYLVFIGLAMIFTKDSP